MGWVPPVENSIQSIDISKQTKGMYLMHIISEDYVSFEKIIIQNKNKNLILDKSEEIKTPVQIELCSKKIKLIIGKERSF